MILDRWKGRGEQTWNIYKIPEMVHQWGFAARLVGEAEPEVAENVRAGWKQDRRMLPAPHSEET